MRDISERTGASIGAVIFILAAGITICVSWRAGRLDLVVFTALVVLLPAVHAVAARVKRSGGDPA